MSEKFTIATNSLCDIKSERHFWLWPVKKQIFIDAPPRFGSDEGRVVPAVVQWFMFESRSSFAFAALLFKIVTRRFVVTIGLALRPIALDRVRRACLQTTGITQEKPNAMQSD